MVARFQPIESVLTDLRRRCTTAGVVFADVRWDPGRNCLCTFELWANGEWRLERELLTDDGEPRQVNEGDIKEIESRMRGRHVEVDNWFKNYKGNKAACEDQRKKWLRSLCADTAREINRRSIRRTVTSSKTNVRWDDQYPCEHGSPQKATCETCHEESKATFYMSG